MFWKLEQSNSRFKTGKNGKKHRKSTYNQGSSFGLFEKKHTDKSKMEISQNFVAFSEYMNFTKSTERYNFSISNYTEISLDQNNKVRS